MKISCRRLLASDMDGTLIPLQDHENYAPSIRELREKVAADPSLGLAYITGRHLELALAGIERYALPPPDVIVCDVGTSIYFRDQQQWKRDEKYAAKLRRSWSGQSGDSIRKLLAFIPQLTPQEEEKQGEFKRSFYLKEGIDKFAVKDHINELFQAKNIAANLIYSFDGKKQIGLLDILPPLAAKDAALHHIAGILDMDRDNVVYAGDSGNDYLAFVCGFKAIVVGNTDEETKKAVRKTAEAKKLQDRIYFSGQYYTAGVLDGCRHFRIFPVS